MIRGRKERELPYLRQIDSYHRRFSTICHDFQREIDGVLRLLSPGDVMSRSEIRANLCAGKMSIDSSIQAQRTGEFIGQNWRCFGNSDNRALLGGDMGQNGEDMIQSSLFCRFSRWKGV